MATASLAGRRWGHAVSGWLVGFPFTSGPITLFLALEQGPPFAAGAATGSLGGVVAGAAFGVGYASAAGRGGGVVASLATGTLAFALIGAALQLLALPPLALVVVVGVVLIAAIRLVGAPPAPRAVGLPRWDLPARMLVATALVLLLTSAAEALGPRLAGLLATVPLYASVLAAFGHRLVGPGAAIRVWRGLLFGLFGFAGFYLALSLVLVPLGLAPGFGLAIGTSLAVQGLTLALLRRTEGIGGPGDDRASDLHVGAG